MDYRDRSRLTFPPFQMSSLKAQKGDTVTQLRSFTVLSRPFIQGLQGNELTRSAYSQPAMISHGRRTSTTSLTRVSRPSSPPLFLSIHQSVPPWRDHPRRPRIRIKFTTTIIAEGFRWVACRINRESKKTLPGNLALLSRSTGFTFTRVRKVLLRIYELSSSLSALFHD